MHIYRLFEQQQKHHRVRKYRNQRNQGLVKFDRVFKVIDYDYIQL